MKKLPYTIVILVFLFFARSGIQGQTTQPQLDQLKLSQQYIGTWQMILNKDTTWITESSMNGKIRTDYTYVIAGGIKSLNSVNLYCYSPADNKFHGLNVSQNGMFLTFTLSFVAENKLVVDVLQNFDPHQLLWKGEYYLETPDTMIETAYNPQGVKIGEYKMTKVK